VTANLIAVLVHIPYLFILLVFVNRYLVGAFVRISKVRRIEPAEWPSVTVTIPCFNEGATIYQTVRSLAYMDYPQDRLVIHVIDDASGPDTRKALECAAAETPNLIVTFRTTNQGKRLSLIDATREAKSEFILSVDSDVIVEHDTLKELLRHMIPEVAAVGGVVRVANPDVNLLTRMQEIKYYIGYEFLKGLENRFGCVMCLSGCLTLFRRCVLREVEGDLIGRNFLGYEVKYGEDRYLTRKIVERGHRTRLCQTAICYTKVPETFDTWFRQQLRWRRSNIVDFLGGWWNAHRLPLPVALHYTSLGTLLILYPLTILHHALSGEIVLPLAAHGVVAALLASLYVGRSVMGGKGLHNSDPLPFLAMPILFMVNYLMVTPLALLTLVTVNWETRSAEPSRR
jgi:cellulose synthase/poly-beta-1,6-N-acetylglucosamine synthase-like glycosyltransferase